MAGVRRKLKAKHKFHGRIFPDRETAEMWLTRMKNKMGQVDYVFGIDPWSDEDGRGFVAYLHGKEDG